MRDLRRLPPSKRIETHRRSRFVGLSEKWRPVIWLRHREPAKRLCVPLSTLAPHPDRTPRRKRLGQSSLIENYCVVALALQRLTLWSCPPRYFFKQLRYQLCDLILRVTSDLNKKMLHGLRPQQPKLNPASMCFFSNCAHGASDVPFTTQ